MRLSRGFTLIELVVTIVIASVLSLAVMQFISAPVDAYVSQSRRAALVDEAQLAIRRIAEDVRSAVPNSVRVGCSGRCVELLHTLSGARYRASPPGDELSFLPADADDRFEVLGPLNPVAGLGTSGLANACAEGLAACVVIYNTGTAGTNVWAADNAATLRAIGGTPLLVQFVNSGFSSGLPAFPASSPEQRFYLADTAITYLCDPSTGTLRRYQGYSHAASQSAVDTHAELVGRSNPAEHALLATRVSQCTFRFTPGTATRRGILGLRLSLSEAGERITLQQQTHVDNLP